MVFLTGLIKKNTWFTPKLSTFLLQRQTDSIFAIDKKIIKNKIKWYRASKNAIFINKWHVKTK